LNELEVTDLNGFINVHQAAAKWDVTPRQIQLWCKAGKFEGALKWNNRDWVIPENAERPPIVRHKHKLNKKIGGDSNNG